ncbi:MAG: PKD domain-containing protein [Myxococcota bacterium]
MNRYGGAGVAGALLALVTGCSTGLEVATDLGTVPLDTGVDNPTAPTNFGPGNNSNPDGNQAPVADAGEDFSAIVSNEVFLDGSNSFDPDGDSLTYTWILQQLPPGSSSFLINETRVESSFFIDRAGSYLVELVVSDGFESSRDTVEIMAEVLNSGPVAVAGPDQNVRIGEQVLLSGGDSYDPDEEPITFEWELVSVPPGSSASLSTPSSSVTTFIADRTGTYTAELVVTDGNDFSAPDSVTIFASETGGSGGANGCLSCQGTTLTSGGVAGGFGLAGLPLLLLWATRRRP